MEVRVPFAIALVCLLIASVFLSACAAGGSFDEPGVQTQTTERNTDAPVPTRLPLVATQIAETSSVPYVIERVVLTTELASDGSPANEVSVLSEEQQNIFLAVRVRDLPPGTRFRANWLENEETIGQSDVRINDPEGNVQWVALPFRAIAALNPAATHSVELLVDDRRINTFAFRVGVGSPSDIIAEATLALGTTDDGEPLSPGNEFDRFAPQIMLIARISNMVDPTGMIFTSHWTRGNVPLAQRPPDDGQPGLGGQSTEADRLLKFTLVPEGNLIPGEHAVAIYLNGAEIAAYNFTISTDDVAHPPPEPTEAPEPTPTEEPTGVAAKDIVVTLEVDEDTSEPDERISTIEGYPTELIEFYVAIWLEDLVVEDTVDLTVGIGNSIIHRHRLPVAALEDGWLATPLALHAPDLPDRTVVYEIIVFINDQRVGGTTLAIESSIEAPAPTPTPDPFAPDPQPDDDDDDDEDD